MGSHVTCWEIIRFILLYIYALLSISNNMHETRIKQVSPGNETLEMRSVRNFRQRVKRRDRASDTYRLRQAAIRSVCSDHPRKIFRFRGRVTDLHSYRIGALFFYVALHIFWSYFVSLPLPLPPFGSFTLISARTAVDRFLSISNLW